MWDTWKRGHEWEEQIHTDLDLIILDKRKIEQSYLIGSGI